MSGQLHGRFIPGTHWIGGWVCPKEKRSLLLPDMEQFRKLAPSLMNLNRSWKTETSKQD